ncbi:hypothetical protein BGX29_001979 [Mortierella sp. GBA35]|nr:hypothetical protein BGX29_001979 [Mortierella sp. GBA35]
MPQSSSSSLDDGGIQDDLYSENDGDIQDSSPLTTAQSGNGDNNDDVPTFNVSETDEDEDTEDSNGDEDNDDHSQDEDSSDVPFSYFSETDEDEDTENSNGDEDNEDDIGSPGPKLSRRKKIGTGHFVKSYFSMKSVADGGWIPANIKLKCTKTTSDPVPIGFRSKSVEWTLYPHELDSTKDYELVIGISSKNLRIVDIEEVVFTINGAEERVEQESLKDEVLNEAEVLRWKLATPKTVHYNNRMEVQVALALKLKPMATPLQTKTFALHYMELHSVGTMNWNTDPHVRVYRPLYDWTLNIRCNGADDTIPYAISESGDYLVTYRSAIELWDLTNNSPSMPPNSSASTDPFSISAAELEHFSLSVSWDGSQIAVSGKGSPFKLFERNRLKFKLEESTKAKTADLAGFDGRGIFHRGAGSQRQGPEDEIFVVVDQNVVYIYSVQHEWKLLRIIHHTSPESSDLLNPRPTSHDISNVIQGRHFTCRNIDIDDNMTDSIFIWNLDSGRLVRTIKAADKVFSATESLSSDASLLLEEVNGVITSFCSRTGAHLATSGYKLGSAVPVRGGNGLFHTSDGLIRSGADFAPIYPSCKLIGSASVLWISKETESFKAFVKDRFRIFRQTWKSSPCNKDCLANLNAARKNVLSFIDFESRLQFSVRVTVSSSVMLTITELSRGKSRVLVLEETDRVTRRDVTFSPKDRALIVEGGTLTSVYEMPRRISEDGSLASVLDPQDQHLKCAHERSYFHSDLGPSSLLQLKKDQMATLAPALRQYNWYCLPFSNGVLFPRYVNQHINQRKGCGTEDFASDDRTVSVPTMKKLCEDWGMTEDGTSLFTQILSLPECQWVPPSIMEFNPVQYFLDEAESRRTALHAKAVFRLLSDYCHQRAKSEHNLLFMSPIAACLPTLLDPDLPHPKSAILALQKMAFFPVSLRSVIMERHALIHPPEFRVEFWNPNPRPLFQCKGPILQLESSGASEVKIDATKDAFKEEIFAATFNMIWTDKCEPDILKDTSYSAGVSPSIFYWITMAPFVVGYKLRPWLGTTVTCHEFPPDALDNPALSALILYKWSFIYNLVDVAVFALPLGGCINQFIVRSTDNEDNDLNPRGPNSWLFSFSILVIAFHLGGKYDQVSDVFTQPNWAFHTMMIMYLFFTVILMLNVLIALINSGYDESDTTWELDWLQNRLLYIESAENLSHYIPGLREKYDIFPQEIYYCLSEAKIQEYKTRWSKKDGLWSPKEDDLWTGPKEAKKDPLEQKVEELRREADELQREMEKRIRRMS